MRRLPTDISLHWRLVQRWSFSWNRRLWEDNITVDSIVMQQMPKRVGRNLLRLCFQ